MRALHRHEAAPTASNSARKAAADSPGQLKMALPPLETGSNGKQRSAHRRGTWPARPADCEHCRQQDTLGQLSGNTAVLCSSPSGILLKGCLPGTWEHAGPGDGKT